MARPPAPWISATTAAAAADPELKLTATGQPSAARALAIAAPIPREPPVTSAQPAGGHASAAPTSSTDQLHVLERALGKAGQNLPWADLHEGRHAALVEPQ